MNRRQPLPPDASTLRRLRGAGAKIRRHGIGWLIRRIASEARHPHRLPGKAWRVAWVILYAGGLGTIGLLLRPFMPRSRVTVFYDLQVSPITFDICWSMVAAEQLRRARGLTDIYFVIVPGPDEGLRTEDGDYEAIVDKPARHWRIINILLPMLWLLPSVRGVTMCSSRRHATFLRVLHGRHIYPARYWPGLPVAHKPRDVLEPARQGGDIDLPLHATAQALRYIAQWHQEHADGRKLIAVTLRDYNYMPQRNSDFGSWRAFADQLDQDEFQIVFVPDTESALKPPPRVLAGQLFLREAAWNVGIRMALYEKAYLNLMVNNGPHGLCMFNAKCRYIMFKILTQSARQTSLEYMKFLGFDIDQSPAFSTPFQKWVWEDDTLPVIKREFAEMCREIESTRS